MGTHSTRRYNCPHLAITDVHSKINVTETTTTNLSDKAVFPTDCKLFAATTGTTSAGGERSATASRCHILLRVTFYSWWQKKDKNKDRSTMGGVIRSGKNRAHQSSVRYYLIRGRN